MRGDLVSRPIADVMLEAENLFKAGVKELLVISQDTSAYGVDVKFRMGFWNGKPVKTHMTQLVTALGELAAQYGAWVRLHYVYPYPHVDDIIPLMAQGSILPYLDVPLQHAHPDVLRAVLEFTKGSTVSTNIAPSTSTLSVISNASFKAAYGGMALFKPMEVMMPELSNSAMCALMLHDVCNDNTAKNPRSTAGAVVAKTNPMMLFASGALHGGVWRLGYKMNSIGVVAAVAYYAKTHWYVPVGLLAVAGSLIGGVVPLP